MKSEGRMFRRVGMKAAGADGVIDMNIRFGYLEI